MHRTPFLNLLHSYADRHPEEAECTERYIAFVESHSDCFERSLAIGHVTGSAWILDETGTKALLTHHRKLDRWLQLGGHVDGNANVLEAAQREALEESGIDSLKPVSAEIFDLDIHEIPARKDEAAHFHYDARFLLQANDDHEFSVSEESHDLAWVALAELDQYTTETSIRRMAAKTPGC